MPGVDGLNQIIDRMQELPKDIREAGRYVKCEQERGYRQRGEYAGEGDAAAPFPKSFLHVNNCPPALRRERSRGDERRALGDEAGTWGDRIW